MFAPVPSNTSESATVGRILLSDDDPAALGALAVIIDRAGFFCRTAASSHEALELLAREEFDLIIADIHMEGNTHLEMVGTLNQRDSMPPIILVTGQPSIETATQAVRLRIFDYMLKPVDGERLVAVAREGVASGRMLKMLRTHRRRMNEALNEIDHCESLSRNATSSTLNEALGTYLGLAVQQSVSTIADIGDLAKSILVQDVAGDAQRRLQSARPLVLIDAIRETIQVLEDTKTSFRSRELAELRKKLEALVKSGRGG